MPVRNCPFTSYVANGDLLPLLAIRLINPHTNKDYDTRGLIDTGASDCAIPASFAGLIGHKLRRGEKITGIATGRGNTHAYAHTTKIELYHPVTFQLLHTIPQTKIDYMQGLNQVLLGVNSLLRHFVLNIDYPNKVFSIKSPTPKLSTP